MLQKRNYWYCAVIHMARGIFAPIPMFPYLQAVPYRVDRKYKGSLRLIK